MDSLVLEKIKSIVNFNHDNYLYEDECKAIKEIDDKSKKKFKRVDRTT